MSSSAIPTQQSLTARCADLHLLPTSYYLVPIASPVRRRANREQGHALEVLGHAVEYLVDSRMFLVDQPATLADSEAVQLLMQLSREVFSECREVTSPMHRLRLWISGRFAVPRIRLEAPLSERSGRPHN